MEFILQIEKVVIKQVLKSYNKVKRRVKQVAPDKKDSEREERLERYIPDHK
jgi:hypothetical protein